MAARISEDRNLHRKIHEHKRRIEAQRLKGVGPGAKVSLRRVVKEVGYYFYVLHLASDTRTSLTRSNSVGHERLEAKWVVVVSVVVVVVVVVGVAGAVVVFVVDFVVVDFFF